MMMMMKVSEYNGSPSTLAMQAALHRTLITKTGTPRSTASHSAP